LNWGNEPAGFTPIADWALDESPAEWGDESISGSNGWKIVYNGTVGRSLGWVALASDSSAPFSASNVYDFVYPAGMVEGTAPGTVYYPSINESEVYVGFWWKPSSPFDYGPNGTKIAFLFNGGGDSGGQQFMILRPDGTLWVSVTYPGLSSAWQQPNVQATPVALGVWHQIEWYSDVRKGTLKWWLDGVLQGSHSDVRNSHPFDMFQLSPTFGGNSGARKRETDHYWFDHVRLSVPRVSQAATAPSRTIRAGGR
jgi:hypothetical protein